MSNGVSEAACRPLPRPLHPFQIGAIEGRYSKNSRKTGASKRIQRGFRVAFSIVGVGKGPLEQWIFTTITSIFTGVFIRWKDSNFEASNYNHPFRQSYALRDPPQISNELRAFTEKYRKPSCEIRITNFETGHEKIQIRLYVKSFAVQFYSLSVCNNFNVQLP